MWEDTVKMIDIKKIKELRLGPTFKKKIMWEEQLFVPPNEYITPVNVP